MPDIEGEDGAARAYYIRLLPLYTMETRRVQLCMQQIEIALSRDCVNPVSNLKIGTQFRDSENAQRNLEIVQIPRLRRTLASSPGQFFANITEGKKYGLVLIVYGRVGCNRKFNSKTYRKTIVKYNEITDK